MTTGILMKVESIAECSLLSILQYFWPALSDNWSLKPFLSFWEWQFYTGFTVQVKQPALSSRKETKYHITIENKDQTQKAHKPKYCLMIPELSCWNFLCILNIKLRVKENVMAQWDLKDQQPQMGTKANSEDLGEFVRVCTVIHHKINLQRKYNYNAWPLNICPLVKSLYQKIIFIFLNQNNETVLLSTQTYIRNDG